MHSGKHKSLKVASQMLSTMKRFAWPCTNVCSPAKNRVHQRLSRREHTQGSQSAAGGDATGSNYRLRRHGIHRGWQKRHR